jgi:GNAT superfamily N-acetyltransferase
MTSPDSDDAPLVAHLQAWLGAWPPTESITVVGAEQRTKPGWDGAIAPRVGLATPRRALLSVAPDRRDAVAAVAGPLADAAVRTAIAAAAGRPDASLGRGVFRWTRHVADSRTLRDVGEWVDPGDPRVPGWLHPFNYGRVLIAWGAAGRYTAGVGIKRHDAIGHELAVVTTPWARGRGLGRRLVAQAARRVLDEGGLPTYLHGPANTASARVADAVGFPDRGWSIYQPYGSPAG